MIKIFRFYLLRISLLSLALSFFFSANTWAQYSTPFDRASEFPNYFFSGSESERKEIRQLLEGILKQRFESMTAPVLKNGQYERVKFVDWAMGEAQKLNLGDRAKFYPSGGLIRNNISLVYEQVHADLKAHPGKSVAQSLKEIQQNTPKEIFHTQIRGVGSDFDFLIGGVSGDEMGKLNSQLASQITNFEKEANLIKKGSHKTSVLKKAFMLIPDFKDLAVQTLDATAQGGLESDFLVFDLKEGKLKDPAQLALPADHVKNYSGAVDRFLEGRVQYHPSYKVETPATDATVKRVREPDAQTVRSLRTLSESPWTDVDDFKGVFVKEVDAVVVQTELSNKAKEQLNKMQRNSRFGGGGNRFVRPLSSQASVTERAIARLKDSKPEYFQTYLSRTDKLEVAEKMRTAPASLKAALLKASELPKTLYHGIKTVDILPSIARNGLILSRADGKDKTKAAFGDGAYSSENYSTAKKYASGSDVVIPIKLKDEANVIDWQKLDRNTAAQLGEQAKKAGKSLHIFLHDEYGVQAVKNGHVMILDMSAIEEPVKKYSDILRYYVDSLQKTPAATRSFTDVNSALQIAKYAELSGEPGIESILDRGKVDWDKMLTDIFGKHADKDLETLLSTDMNGYSEQTRKVIVQKLQSPQIKEALAKDIWGRPDSAFHKIRRFGAGADSPEQAALVKQLKSVLSDGRRLTTEITRDPARYTRLLDTFSNVDPSIKEEISKVFTERAGSKALADNLARDISASIESTKRYLPIVKLKELPSALQEAVLNRLAFKPEVIEGLGKIYAFKGGDITPIGRWMQKNDSKAFAKFYESNARSLKGVSYSQLEQLHKEGLSMKAISEARVFSNNHRLTEAGRWALKTSPKEAVTAFTDLELRSLAKGPDAHLILETGSAPRQAMEKALRIDMWASRPDDLSDLDKLVSDKPMVRNEMKQKLYNDLKYRKQVLDLVEKYGDSRHIEAFPWRPDHRDDQVTMSKMLSSKERDMSRLDTRVSALADRNLQIELGRKPTATELKERVEVLKKNPLVADLYQEAELKSQRKLPELSPSATRSLRATANVQSPQSKAPEKVETGKVPPEVCP